MISAFGVGHWAGLGHSPHLDPCALLVCLALHLNCPVAVRERGGPKADLARICSILWYPMAILRWGWLGVAHLSEDTGQCLTLAGSHEVCLPFKLPLD